MVTSFVESPGHQHPQYCNNQSEGLAIDSPTSTRLCLVIFFSDFVRICFSDFALSYRM